MDAEVVFHNIFYEKIWQEVSLTERDEVHQG